MTTLQSVTTSNSYNDYVFHPAKKISFSTDEVLIFGELKITVPHTAEEILTTEFEEKSRFQGTIMELKSINHPRLELFYPITLIVEYIEDEYIVSCPLVEIFTYERDSNKAKEDFGIFLGDYYESLVRNKDSLAINLLDDLKFLSGILRAKNG